MRTPEPCHEGEELLARACGVFSDVAADVDGARISWRVFDGDAATPLLFVHGGSAHGRWWDPLVARLRDERTCATLDLSGHGASGRREEYSFATWVEEVRTVAGVQFPRGCVVVGHSLGAAVACAAAVGNPTIRGIVAVDSDGSGPEHSEQPASLALVPPRVFDRRQDAEAAVVRRKGSWPAWLADYVASRSVHGDPAGWRMHSDPAVRGVRVPRFTLKALGATPTAVLIGEHSPFASQLRRSRAEAGQGATLRFIDVPGAGHDIMMELPGVVAAHVRDLLRAVER